MLKPHFTQEQLVQVARLSDADIAYLNACRGVQNKIGSAYQICYVKLFNCFPVQSSFEVLEELATFVAIQLGIPREQLARYARRQPTISVHQEQIRRYLGLKAFAETAQEALREYLFAQAHQIQETESLFLKATEYLRARKIVNPADYVIERLIKAQREKARGSLYERMRKGLTPKICRALDDLLVVGETHSKLYQIKEVPKKPSEKAMKLLAHKLNLIEQTGVLTMPMDWLNNNYKRYLRRYVTRCV